MTCQYSWHRNAGVSPFGINSDQKRTCVNCDELFWGCTVLCLHGVYMVCIWFYHVLSCFIMVSVGLLIVSCLLDHVPSLDWFPELFVSNTPHLPICLSNIPLLSAISHAQSYHSFWMLTEHVGLRVRELEYGNWIFMNFHAGPYWVIDVDSVYTQWNPHWQTNTYSTQYSSCCTWRL